MAHEEMANNMLSHWVQWENSDGFRNRLNKMLRAMDAQ